LAASMSGRRFSQACACMWGAVIVALNPMDLRG
jgi:hypothetical protein